MTASAWRTHARATSYAAFDPYRPYETGPYASPQRPAPRGTSPWLALLVPAVAGALTVLGAGGGHLAPGSVGPASKPRPAAGSTPTATPSPTPTGPRPPLASRPQADDLGKQNPLYAVQVPAATACAGFTARTGQLTQAELEPYLTTLVDCLMTVHSAPLRARGITLSRPELRPETRMAESQCGHGEGPDDWAGRYCAADNAIYYRTDPKTYTGLDHQLVMTHEFSHHLQKESRIVSSTLAQTDGDQPANQQFVRRVELQATCMSGALLQASWSPLKIPRTTWLEYLASMEDMPPQWAVSHGTGQAQERWTKASLAGPQAYAGCNTWRAAPGDVT